MYYKQDVTIKIGYLVIFEILPFTRCNARKEKHFWKYSAGHSVLMLYARSIQQSFEESCSHALPTGLKISEGRTQVLLTKCATDQLSMVVLAVI